MKKPRWKAAVLRAVMEMVAARIAGTIDDEIEKKMTGQFFATTTSFNGSKMTMQHHDYRAVFIDPTCA